MQDSCFHNAFFNFLFYYCFSFCFLKPLEFSLALEFFLIFYLFGCSYLFVFVVACGPSCGLSCGIFNLHCILQDLFFQLWHCCRKGDPFQGLKLGSCLTLRNELSKGTHVLTKQEILLGKGTQVESRRVREPRRTALPQWLAVLGFMVTGLVSGLSLASHFHSESFLKVQALFSQDGCQREGFWEVVGHVVSPFDLSRTLLVSGGLLVPCSLPGAPVVKQLMQMVAMVPGQGGRFQSASPNKSPRRDFILKILLGNWVRGLFCKFFLLCLGIGLPSRAEVSLYLT